jgi:chromosome segregation ATPase
VENEKISFVVKIVIMDGLQIFSIIIGTAGVIGSFIALATHIINRRIDDMNKRIDDTNERIDSLERRMERIEEDNKGIRKEMGNIRVEMRGDMKEMKARMDSMGKGMERIESDVRDIKNLLYKIIDISQNQRGEIALTSDGGCGW